MKTGGRLAPGALISGSSPAQQGRGRTWTFTEEKGLWGPRRVGPQQEPQGPACARWTTGAQPRSWRPTSATVVRSTGSPSCATSSPDAPRGQCKAWGRDTAGHRWPGSPCPHLHSHPQLCLRRVCRAELRPGRCEAGQQHFPRPGHQGKCPPGVTVHLGTLGCLGSVLSF